MRKQNRDLRIEKSAAIEYKANQKPEDENGHSSPALETLQAKYKQCEQTRQSLVSDLQKQVAQNKSLVEHISSLEGKLAELAKKYDECKRGYFKAKEERDKLRQELGGEPKTEQPDVAQKYESLKQKYRVSPTISTHSQLQI